MNFFKKSVAPAGYKNKQTSVLSEGTFLAYVPLRSATERERVAFLIPCQGLRGFESIWVYTEKLSCEIQNSLQITHKKLNMGL